MRATSVPERSAIPFVDGRSRRRVDALSDAEVGVSSRALGWPGLLVEAGHNAAWEVDDLTVEHHYVALNVDPQPLTFEVRGPHGFRPVTLAPGDAWVCPAGEPFTHRVGDPNAYALVAIAPDRLDRLVRPPDAPPVALRRTYGVRVPQIEHVVKALVVEADRGNPGGLAFVDALTMALAVQLVAAAGAEPPSPPPLRGGLAPAARRRVLERMAASVGRGGVTVDALAREAGLSAAHFARAFKQSVGRSPHQHLLGLQVEHARRLLEAPGARISDVALRAGFADQAHLTRHFARAFGATPGAFLRSRRPDVARP
jgi:AraC family transcriptional regulator